MPASFVKGPEGEKRWEDAKKVVDEEYPDLKNKDESKYYAFVTAIYKKMCKNNECSPKSESMIEELDLLYEKIVNPSAMGNVKERISGINSFIEPFRKFYKDILWPIETGKKAAAANFIQMNPSVKKEFDNLMSACSGIVMAAKDTGKYVNVEFTAKDVHGIKESAADIYMEMLSEAWMDKTGEEWQMLSFDDQKKNERAEKALNALNAAMTKAIKKALEKIGSDFDEQVAGEEIGRAIKQILVPVYKTYADVGANDNAVRARAMQWMIDAVKKKYGVRGRTDIADYI